MTADGPFGTNAFRDETRLDFCPRCGVRLEKGTRPVSCPEHGPLALTYQELPTDGEIAEMLFGDDGPEGAGAWMEDVFGAFAEEMERHAERDEHPPGGVRDRINRLFGSR